MDNLDLSLYRSIEALADNDIPNPILRIDFFLHAVITGEECNIEPVTKTEEYLYALATGDESRLRLYGDSISLLEEYLEALRTGDMDNLREPRTREEIILYQAITGEDLGVEPVSRIETYLSMLQNAGGLDYILSTSTSASVIPLTNSINGKARVQEMCGDTLVNLVDRYSYSANKYLSVCFFKSGMLKPSTKYSAIITNLSNENMKLYWNEDIFNYVEIIIPANSTKVFTHTTKAEMNIDKQSILFKNTITHTQAIQFKVILLEGDWTNCEIPSEYFEGMKSCGETKDNMIDVEVIDTQFELEIGSITGSDGINLVSPTRVRTKDYIPYTGEHLVIEGLSTELVYVFCYDENKKYLKRVPTDWSSYPYSDIDNNVPSTCKYIRVVFCKNDSSNCVLEDYDDVRFYFKSTKHTIQLPQPLRGLPSGVQDRIVYLDENTTPIAPEGEGLYLEKNVGEVFVNNLHGLGSYSETITQNGVATSRIYISYETVSPIFPNIRKGAFYGDFVTDKLPNKVVVSNIQTEHGIAIGKTSSGVSIRLVGSHYEECQEWLSNNPFVCQYALQTPTYTKISDVNFECYENATVYVDSGAVAPTKTVIRYPYKQPALFSL